jgi:hypothetical protein
MAYENFDISLFLLRFISNTAAWHDNCNPEYRMHRCAGRNTANAWANFGELNVNVRERGAPQHPACRGLLRQRGHHSPIAGIQQYPLSTADGRGWQQHP